MALIGRGMGLIHSSRRVRKSKERHSVRTSASRFQVEQLETRTLLATGPFPEPSQLLPLGAFAPNAAISFESSVRPSYDHESAVFALLDQTDAYRSGARTFHGLDQRLVRQLDRVRSQRPGQPVRPNPSG